ncbi:hypothetical protein CYMTET_50519 [Cymbomonas tetramitiformis]|uniref:Tetratricopeptide repeat protein n=1 Tax=Cymbomonas tetramitiformis TaxID=36881 RepID=A0AAE0BMY1_9CHLO|nr:hypothetical protein CYMTET_50519 [Cymbomonas tetramitiformis]|eukprot:gene16720-19861_t
MLHHIARVYVFKFPIDFPNLQVRLEDVTVPEIRAGVRAAARGDFDTAEEYFKALTRNMPDSASAWSNLANAELSQGKLEDALEHLTTAVRLAPDAPVPYLNRAIVKEALGSRSQMQGDLKEAQGFFMSAIDDCNRSIQLDPNEFAAYYNKANVLARLEDYYGALREYTAAADLAPGIAGYRFKQAIMAYQVGDDLTAKALLRGLGRKYPVYSEAKAALSAILWAEGEAASAENQYIDAFSRDPLVGDMEYIRNLFWTPRLLDAMEDFLHIEFRKP